MTDGCTPQDGPDEPVKPPDSMPADPFGAGQIPYVALHQAYLNLRCGGFAWYEALFYLASNMSLNVLFQQPQVPPEQETP